MSKPPPVAFLSHFAALRDPRQAAKVLYPLPEILLIVLCGTLAGADDFVELALWGRENLGFLRGFARFAHGIPSHDTGTRGGGNPRILAGVAADIQHGCGPQRLQGAIDKGLLLLPLLFAVVVGGGGVVAPFGIALFGFERAESFAEAAEITGEDVGRHFGLQFELARRASSALLLFKQERQGD